MFQGVLRGIAKAALVIAGCVVAGFTIGAAAHFLGGARYFGLNWEAFQFAAGEGGVPGGLLGLLVGLPTFYAVLRGRATTRDWAILVGVTFVTATIVCFVASVLTIVVTPLVTIAAAVAMRSK